MGAKARRKSAVNWIILIIALPLALDFILKPKKQYKPNIEPGVDLSSTYITKEKLEAEKYRKEQLRRPGYYTNPDPSYSEGFQVIILVK